MNNKRFYLFTGDSNQWICENTSARKTGYSSCFVNLSAHGYGSIDTIYYLCCALFDVRQNKADEGISLVSKALSVLNITINK
jgi:hypothetical protein